VWVVFSFFENIKYGSPALIVNTSLVVFVIELNDEAISSLTVRYRFFMAERGALSPCPQLEGEMPPLNSAHDDKIIYGY